MKGYESQQKSYNKQKEIFETARGRRITNREKQIRQINQKIESLLVTRGRLIQQNENEKEFESFESFRLKSEEQSSLQKNKKTTI